MAAFTAATKLSLPSAQDFCLELLGHSPVLLWIRNRWRPSAFNWLVWGMPLVSGERVADTGDWASPTILVVEDDVLIRMALAAMMRDEGFAVIEACNADEALVAVSSVNIDVLVTDVRMSGSMDGLQLAKRIRSGRPDTKIVVVSGHLAAEEADGVADAFIPKPYLAERVINCVRQMSGRVDPDHAH